MKRPFPSILLTAAALVGMATALPAAAQFAKPEDAIKYRQSAMFLQAQHMGRIGAMVNGRVPFDAKVGCRERGSARRRDPSCPFSAFIDGTRQGRRPAPSPRSGPRRTSSWPVRPSCRKKSPS